LTIALSVFLRITASITPCKYTDLKESVTARHANA
jgi:hypothetical protein